MKLKDFFLSALMSLTLCFVATSCGSDDDSDGGSGSGNSTITVNNTKYSFSNGYYWKDNNGDMNIEFYNFNLNNWSASSNFSMNYVSINYPCNSDTPQPVTLSASDYWIYYAVGWTNTSDGNEEEAESYYGNSSELVISKDGSTYHISVTNATGKGGSGDDWDSVTISLDLNGSLSPLPEEYRE